MFTAVTNTYKAQSSAIVRFLRGDDEVADVDHSNNPAPGHDEDDGDILGCVLGAPPRGCHHQNGNKRQRLRPTKTKHKRAKYP